MEKVSSILADFRLNFGDDQKRHVMTSREKCSKSIELVDSLLLCSQQQIDQFLSPALDSLLKLATDDSRDVRQASGFGSKLHVYIAGVPIEQFQKGSIGINRTVPIKIHWN